MLSDVSRCYTFAAIKFYLMSRLKMSAETTVDSSRVEVPSFPESIPEGKGGEVCRKMLHYLNQKRVYLDRNLSLAKFSSIVGTAIARICTAAWPLLHGSPSARTLQPVVPSRRSFLWYILIPSFIGAKQRISIIFLQFIYVRLGESSDARIIRCKRKRKTLHTSDFGQCMVTRRERAARAVRSAVFDIPEGKTAVFLPHFPDWTFSANAYFWKNEQTSA